MLDCLPNCVYLWLRGGNRDREIMQVLQTLLVNWDVSQV